MAARFSCRDVFCIPERSYFVLAGDVVDGVIRAGMRATLPRSDGTVVELVIDSIEMIHGPRATLGLVVKCDSQVMLDNCRALPVAGTEITLG